MASLDFCLEDILPKEPKAKRRKQEKNTETNGQTAVKKKSSGSKYTCVLEIDKLVVDLLPELPNALASEDLEVKIEEQDVAGLLRWHVKSSEGEIYEDDNVVLIPPPVMLVPDFLEDGVNSLQQRLVEFVRACQTFSPLKRKVHLILWDFFPSLKRAGGERRVKEANNLFQIFPLQSQSCCACPTLSSADELFDYLRRMRRSVVSKPEKLNRRSQYSFDWCEEGSTSNKSVRVDSSGNGVSAFWRQILCSLSGVTTDTAEAIVSVYPTIGELFQAYDKVDTETAEVLLADIKIRKGQGPMSAIRRIGPELSKRIHRLLTSLDGNVVMTGNDS